MNLRKFLLALVAWLLTSLAGSGTTSLWAQSVDASESNPASVQTQPASPRIKLVHQPVPSSEANENMLDNHNRFAYDMYQQLGKEPGNLFFSPSSVWTALAMTNAVYFKGSWLRPFNADSTQEADFRLTAAESIPVPMMHQLGGFAYNSLDDVQILELPYGDGRLSMLILLPIEVEGLAKLEAQLTVDNLQRWTQLGFRSQKVNVYLPKFKSTSQFELNAVLSSMGMPSAFDPSEADFSKMSGNRELCLSAVIHKAFVDVNEAGTEAAAATGAVISKTSIDPRPPVEFRADHPFVYLIRDTRSGAVLFAGRVADPSR